MMFRNNIIQYVCLLVSFLLTFYLKFGYINPTAATNSINLLYAIIDTFLVQLQMKILCFLITYIYRYYYIYFVSRSHIQL